ncbi:glycosyltransferase family 4 protein [Novosphingobium sp. ST904]|uniref:glycosyltransferase family 4 protein n=1 Tax=Novosphingobium sp. ST904 TaxID=1684385 RepID=UPI0010434EA4|nr:glycosyltransferase family 4 protein [Novosphingobium sp. ST904]
MRRPAAAAPSVSLGLDYAMKVLVLSSLAYSLTNFRGALLRELKANGHDVIAVAPDRNPAVEADLSAWGVGLRIVPMARTGTNPVKDASLLSAYLRLMTAEKPDLVLAYTQKPIIYGGIAARMLCVPRFFALMSGLGYVFSEGSGAGKALRWAVARLYREAVRRSRGVFVFNADDRKDMIHLGIVTPRQNVVQVPGSGIDLERFHLEPLPRNRLRFLLVGRLMRDKGIYEFAEAARQIKLDHPDVEFCVLGHYERDNPTGIDEVECARLARQFPVQFIPGTSDVRPYLAGCSVFVLPSYYREGLPRTILEAMATGRPIITTDMPGCREPVIEGENGFLVKPRDAGALRAAMQRFVDAPQLVAGMAARSRDLVEKIYDVRKVNHQLLDEMDLLREPWNEPATLHEAPDPLDDLPRSPAGMHDAATSRAIAS